MLIEMEQQIIGIQNKFDLIKRGRLPLGALRQLPCYATERNKLGLTKQFPKRINFFKFHEWVAFFFFECPRLICGTV